MEFHKSIGFGRIEDIALLAHFTVETDDAEWSQHIALCQKMEAVKKLGHYLVLAGPGTLSAAQRESIKNLYQSSQMKIVVLTDSRFARGVLTALSWFGIPSEGFPPDALRQALESIDRARHYEHIREQFDKCKELQQRR